MTKRTGNRPGQGRQPTIAPRGQVAKITARVSEQQHVEYMRRGGSTALRAWLDGKLSGDHNSNTVAHNASSNQQGDEMKDTNPRLGEFRPQFAAGATCAAANAAAAAHGAEMDAPSIMPAGGWENVATCDAYPWPRSGRVGR